MSVLGALAWLLQARADIPVQVQALQRRGSAPRKVDLQRAATLVRYVQARPAGLWLPALTLPVTFDLYSDSAFKAVDGAASALALKGMVLMVTPRQTGLNGPALLLDCYSSKQKRVVRSTYAAELHAALDNLERGYMAQFLLTELMSLPNAVNARQLMSRWQSGSLSPPLR
eukprot:1760596-Amphidinium_carterae.1